MRSSSLRRTHQMQPPSLTRNASVADIELPPRDIPAEYANVSRSWTAHSTSTARHVGAGVDYAAQRAGGLRVRKIGIRSVIGRSTSHLQLDTRVGAAVRNAIRVPSAIRSTRT